MSSFGEDVELAAAPAPKVWRLVVWRVAPAHVGLMARLKLIPSKKNPSTYWRNYPGNKREQVMAAIVLLRDAGLHGNAALHDPPRKQYPGPAAAKRYRSKKPQYGTSREGFGHALNARPIPSAWRRRSRHA
jgi:hypothetical protein